MSVKFELAAWSDAELDLISAKAIAGALESVLHAEGNLADAELAFAAYRMIESALSSLEAGRKR